MVLIKSFGPIGPNHTVVELGSALRVQCLTMDSMSSGVHWYVFLSLLNVHCTIYPDAESTCELTDDASLYLSRFKATRINFLLALDVRDVTSSDTGLYACVEPSVGQLRAERIFVGQVGVVTKSPTIETLVANDECSCGGIVQVTCSTTFVDVAFFSTRITWRDTNRQRLRATSSDAYSSVVEVLVPRTSDCQRSAAEGSAAAAAGAADTAAIADLRLICRVEFTRSQQSMTKIQELVDKFSRSDIVVSTNQVTYDECVLSEPCRKADDTWRLIQCENRTSYSLPPIDDDYNDYYDYDNVNGGDSAKSSRAPSVYCIKSPAIVTLLLLLSIKCP